MKKFTLQAVFFIIILLGLSFFQIRRHIPRSTKAPIITGLSKGGIGTSKDFGEPTASSLRPTLVYFFAPWCGVCKIAMENLKLLPKMAGVNIVLVALDFETSDEVIDLIDEKHLSEFELIMGNQKTNLDYKIEGYPTYYVISDQGEVVTSSVGYSTTLGMLVRIWLAAMVA